MYPTIITDAEHEDQRLRHLSTLLGELNRAFVAGRTDASWADTGQLVREYALQELVSDTDEALYPVPVALVRWIAEGCKASSLHLFKETDACDIFLTFHLEDDGRAASSAGSPGLNLAFRDVVLTATKLRLPKIQKTTAQDPARYDWYSKAITADSTILFMDRPEQAGDNAECAYRMFREEYPEYNRIVFALNRDSEDWPRLEADGFTLVEAMSEDYYAAFLEADVVFSSHLYPTTRSGKNYSNCRLVFLQHGVQLTDMNRWLHTKHFDYVLATGADEADYLEKHFPGQVLVAGQPRLHHLAMRHAALQQESVGSRTSQRRHVFVMPTWRYGMQELSVEEFTRTEYFQKIHGLLTHEGLGKDLQATGGRISLLLHPVFKKFESAFEGDQRFNLWTGSYEQAFLQATEVVTNYSSAVLDAAYIGTPVLYYQWDRESFFDSQHYFPRLDFEKDGLGPVFEDADTLVAYLQEQEPNNPAQEYAQRVLNFYRGVDPLQGMKELFELVLSASSREGR
ncbi:CDP-glycerol glycerophosphotransferase family protein [Rothia nasimurium]|uniref:CDP-glycerol glycerophosphotransferase family protein n=1 Tax=Rothia nasimurium TaxID=85336 RepID=UPI001F48E111|nr:CDP-glycerol glycerophosphotransferase family protein [Rothia nasimurium]